MTSLRDSSKIERGMLKTRKNSIYLFCYLSLAPVLALFIVTRVIPIVRTFWFGFTNWDLTRRGYDFIGFDNYVRMWNDKYFWAALKNTTIFSFSEVILSLSVALPIAVLLASKLKFSSFYHAIYFLPYITPMVPMSIAWKWIYDSQYGLLNYALSLVGIPRVSWLLDRDVALWAIIIMSVWQRLGYNIVILLVGIRNIPRTYYEAASIDGAGVWQQFRGITLPLLRPVLLFLIVVSTIEAYNVFTQVYVMTIGTQSAPTEAVRVLVLEIYQNAFTFFRMGYASSQAVVLTLIVLVLTFIQFRVLPSLTDE